MRFTYWAREAGGWVLVLAGMFMFVTAYNLLLNKRIFEAGPATFIAFIVLRSGVHLLKVAVAAQAARTLPESSRPAPRRVPGATARPIGPTPPRSVLPGPKTGRPAADGRG